MTQILLIHPPAALPCEPPLGVGILAGQLRAAGVSVTVIDANIEALTHLLTEPAPLIRRTTADHRALRGRAQALALLRQARGYSNFDRYHGAVKRLALALRLAGQRRSDQTHVGLADYSDARLSPLSRADLLSAAAAPASSPYIDYFRSLLERVATLRPELVGLSLNYLHQALPALALAGLLRQRLPQTPLVAGGALLGCWRGRLDPRGLAPAVDELVFGEGAAALLARLGRQVTADPGLPTAPDYQGLPWELYLSPERVAPVCTTYGCVWGRCRYCPEAATQQHASALAPESVPALLQHVQQQTSAQLLHLTDSAIPPTTLAALAGQPTPRWYGFTRFWPELADPSLCRDLGQAGCAMLQIGLESGSPAVLRRLRKGIQLGQASRTLRALSDAKIPVYLYIMFGIPGETRADALRTLAFVTEHAEQIAWLNTSLLNLPIVSPLEPDLEPLPLSGPENDLTLYQGFHCQGSWERREARLFLEREFIRQPQIAAIMRRTPPVFGANHAPFFLPPGPEAMGRTAARPR